MLDGRLPSFFEGLLFALFVAGLFALVAVFARVALQKRIGSPLAYAVVVVSAFVLHRALVLVFPEGLPDRLDARDQRASSERVNSDVASALVPPKNESAEGDHSHPHPGERAGAPTPRSASTRANRHVASNSLLPTSEDLEQARAHVYIESEALSFEESAELSEALSFLGFGSNLSEADPTQLDDANDLDRATQALVRIYLHAQGQLQGQEELAGMHGALLTPAAYLDLANEIKGLQPEWWERFREAKSSAASSTTPRG